MPTLNINKSYADGEVLFESDLDNIINDTETFINVTKLDDDNLQDNGITASLKLVDGTITTAKLASDAVTTAKIIDDAVTTSKIINDAVTTAKILDANVTTAKILDANVTTAKLADNAVTTAKILNANVTTAKLADGAVTAAKLSANSVSQVALQNGNYVVMPGGSGTAIGTGGWVDTTLGTSSSMVVRAGRAVFLMIQPTNPITTDRDARIAAILNGSFDGSITVASSSGSVVYNYGIYIPSVDGTIAFRWQLNNITGSGTITATSNTAFITQT